MLGRPLFCWILTEAVYSNLDKIFVYTDDSEIIDFIEKNTWSSKITAIKRPGENATDEATTEMAILDFYQNNSYEFDIFCLLQATSPLTRRQDINKCLEVVMLGKDSCLSVVNSHRFVWNKEGVSINYNYMDRPRRQEFEGLLVENGAIYCTTKTALENSKNRISGNIGLIEMPDYAYTEIDSQSDWKVVEQLLIHQLQIEKSHKKITHLFLDVDGVFTDGTVLYSENGELAKAFDMRDGMGLEILRQNNVEVIVITSEQSALVAARMKKLNIDKVFLGIKDKYGLLQKIIHEDKMDASKIAYIGDDINDMANICKVGWSFAPKNALPEIKSLADVNLAATSGAGSIREACGFIIKYNKRFE